MAKPRNRRVSEFEGRLDKDKTIPIKPRPVRRPSHMLRMGYLTGDNTGRSPRDKGQAFRGERKPE